jgi:hypothetical protein
MRGYFKSGLKKNMARVTEFAFLRWWAVVNALMNV